jgi:hypothetical protein
VLDNDKPFGNLKLLGVDRLGPGWGTMRMDSTNTFFYYTVDTNAMPKGMRFTDKFKCVQFDTIEPTGLTMRSLQHRPDIARCRSVWCLITSAAVSASSNLNRQCAATTACVSPATVKAAEPLVKGCSSGSSGSLGWLHEVHMPAAPP